MRNFHTHVAHLRSAFAGNNSYGDVEFDVGSVIVLPQPLGALVNFSRYHEFDKEDPHLIIDVGYFTTDWVVATGLTIDEERSGGHHSGASHYYEAIAAVIKEKLHIDTQGLSGSTRRCARDRLSCSAGTTMTCKIFCQRRRRLSTPRSKLFKQA